MQLKLSAQYHLYVQQWHICTYMHTYKYTSLYTHTYIMQYAMHNAKQQSTLLQPKGCTRPFPPTVAGIGSSPPATLNWLNRIQQMNIYIRTSTFLCFHFVLIIHLVHSPHTDIQKLLLGLWILCIFSFNVACNVRFAGNFTLRMKST